MNKLFSLLFISICTAGLFAQNLLPDSLFTVRGQKARLPLGWTAALAGDASACVDADVRHGDARALRITAPCGAARTWNVVNHVVPGFKARTPYTVSAWVKTRDIASGGFAYISLNCFGGHRRLAANDSPTKIVGTKD